MKVHKRVSGGHFLNRLLLLVFTVVVWTAIFVSLISWLSSLTSRTSVLPEQQQGEKFDSDEEIDFVLPEPEQEFLELENIDFVLPRQPSDVFELVEKIDWHDEEFIRAERGRRGRYTWGFGENGEAVVLPADHDRNKYQQLFDSNQYNALLSDYISVNRSVPDTRPEGCQQMKYRRDLPDASIIIPVHDEHWSALLRTIHSVLNRSPPKLIKEIILVDDGSTKEFLKTELDNYIATNLPKVRVLRILPPSKGLMVARSIGASYAAGEVLIFMDAHVEVNVNWLPPLLDPIAENYKACVSPVLDAIDMHTYEYKPSNGSRGNFDWKMTYTRFPLLKEDLLNPTRPYKTPVMMGAVSAISVRFFRELGGYDPGLQLWGGEQYELSFKVWQCGGILLDAPCSKVGHTYRATNAIKEPNLEYYVCKNYKRVSEVWMDEYTQYIHMRLPELRNIDPGDLSNQRALRERLKCKSFKWFMEEVAFDLVERFPLIEPPDYGSGKIRPLRNNQLCLTVRKKISTELSTCSPTIKDDQCRQDFRLTWRKDIQIVGTEKCLGIFSTDQNLPRPSVFAWNCDPDSEDQIWRYDLESGQIKFAPDCKICMSYDVEANKVFAEACDQILERQKWLVDSLNKEALQNWNLSKPLVTQHRLIYLNEKNIS